MSQTIQPGVFLRNVLKADALISAGTAAAMLLGSTALAQITGVPAQLLLIVGIALIPWVAYLLWVATRPAVPRAAVWAVIVLNGVWVADCALLAFGIGFEPSRAGVAFAAANALGTLLLADLEFVGLRRSQPVPA